MAKIVGIEFNSMGMVEIKYDDKGTGIIYVITPENLERAGVDTRT